MPDINRTEDWPRLRQLHMLTVDDQPGRIMIRREKPGAKQLTRYKILFALAVGIGLSPALFGNIVLAIATTIVMTIFASLTFGVLILSTIKRVGRFADGVAFTPDWIEFYQGKKLWRLLPREGMQQIVAQEDPHGLLYHRFVADTGYCSAFPALGATDQALVNNVLMAAFNQPVEMDDTLLASERRVIAPQLDGLRPSDRGAF